jgi:hypothetical protein
MVAMSTYRAVRNTGLLMLLVVALNPLQPSALAQNSTASLDFSSGGVAIKGVASYAMNRCRLEDMGDQNRRLRMFPGDKFSFMVNCPETANQVLLRIEHSFAEDPSKLAPKIKPPSKSEAAKPAGKQANLTLYVNGQLAHSWVKSSGGFKSEEVTVSYLKSGLNAFELRFVDDIGTSCNWIKSIGL